MKNVSRRIEGLLKRKGREALLPAWVCLSLGLGGCLGCSDGVPFLSRPGSEVFAILPDADVPTATVRDGGKTDGPPVCPQTNCPALSCAMYASNPNDPCSCPTCLPTPDAGVAKDRASQFSPPACPATTCRPKILCPGGYQPNPDNPCCPVCAPAPDAGVDAAAPDTGLDAETTPFCGDGIVDTDLGEECDLGPSNGVLGVLLDAGGNPPQNSCARSCTADCRIPLCLL